MVLRRRMVVVKRGQNFRDKSDPPADRLRFVVAAKMQDDDSGTGGLILDGPIGPGKFSTITTAATISSASSLRDMQGIRIIPAIASGTSSAVVQYNQLL